MLEIKQPENDTTNKKKFMTPMKKVAVLAGVVGLVGGGVGAAGVTYLENSELLNPVSVGTTTPVKVANSNVKGDTEATKAFNIASGAVVSVINLQKQQATGAYSMFGETESKDSSSSDNDLETASEGSGVIYKKSGDTAYIVTNNHVVADSNALQVLLSDGTKLTATLVGTDDITDLAVLKVKADKIKDIAQFANSNEIKAGQSVIAIGSPMGSEYATSVTAGIISATKREVASTDESGNSLGTATVIQTDAPINSGNSGGALVNMAGQVVGINSMKLSSSGTGATIEGMGFAIPSNTVVNIINQLEKTGKIERPALGIKMLDLTSISVTDQEKTLKLPSSVKGGVVVMDTIDDTPAKTLGLEKYDVITKIDGKAVDGSGDLRDALYEHKIGDTIKVTYYRDGKEKTEPVNLTAKTSQLDD